MPINTHESFRLELEDILHHLYDPDYSPPALLCDVIGCDPTIALETVQARVRQAIDGLKPTAGIPAGSRQERAYETLYHRFVLGLTHDETAEAIHLSPRTVQRTQREAIHTLALELWQIRYGKVNETPELPAPPGDEGVPPDWHAHAAQELASLQASAPDRVTDVAEVLQGLLDLGSILTADSDITLTVKYIQPGLVATVHPSALRQTLIAAVTRLVQRMTSGQVGIYAGLEDGNAKLTLTATIEAASDVTEQDYTREILVPVGGSISVEIEGNRVYIHVKVPSTGGTRVLAIDDNPDMIHFYRRCTTGTVHQIVAASNGKDALAMITDRRPDLILLDVMLPDMDGWKLLMRLHENLETRSIPVIICTVIREETLAYSLGAAGFLSKPIQPRELVEALDRARRRATA